MHLEHGLSPLSRVPDRNALVYRAGRKHSLLRGAPLKVLRTAAVTTVGTAHSPATTLLQVTAAESQTRQVLADADELAPLLPGLPDRARKHVDPQLASDPFPWNQASTPHVNMAAAILATAYLGMSQLSMNLSTHMPIWCLSRQAPRLGSVP